MPIYTVRNNTTGEEKDVILKMSEKDDYLKDKPDCEFIITKAPGLGDAIRLGLKKPDNAWKEVLHRIHESAPGSTLKDNSSVW